jgi:hypothetical protein
MSFTAFLLKLVGKHPEQVEEQKRFEDNMEELDDRGRELDSLLDGIREVDKTVRTKSEAYEYTAQSMRPSKHDRPEEQEDSGGDSVSIEEPLPG